MSSTTQNLADTAKAFEVAHAALIDATKTLDREVEAAMATLHTVPELQNLVDELPKHYTNARRVYEKIYRLGDGLTS
jgi:cell division protein ZapA (FtsZ GTPase activity inhibitor)